ncbi:hypothetical protein H1C71_024699, partial [Ictidomys tridecemlineatus]
ASFWNLHRRTLTFRLLEASRIPSPVSLPPPPGPQRCPSLAPPPWSYGFSESGWAQGEPRVLSSPALTLLPSPPITQGSVLVGPGIKTRASWGHCFSAPCFSHHRCLQPPAWGACFVFSFPARPRLAVSLPWWPPLTLEPGVSRITGSFWTVDWPVPPWPSKSTLVPSTYSVS